MTGTLKGVMKGDIDILDLQGATFHFGCAKEHLDIGGVCVCCGSVLCAGVYGAGRVCYRGSIDSERVNG